MNNKKRAFTIVELVIVIAVIAILAAVLIPTFSNLIEKANESRDTSLIKNLNTSLVMEEVNGKKNNTMTDALNAALAHGYTVEKLTPTSSGDIVWNQTDNTFALIKNDALLFGSDKTKDLIPNEMYKLWKITSDVNEVTSSDAKYSYYLADNFSSDSLTVQTGIDVGKNNIAEIIYKTTAAKSIIINTNEFATHITVDAVNSDVEHYGIAYEVKIDGVKNASYHEFGKVLNRLTIKSGHVQLENGSVVDNLVIESKDSGKEHNASVTFKEQSKTNVVVISTSDFTTTGATNIGSVVVTDDSLKSNATNNFNVAEVDTINKDNLNKFAGGIGTKDNPYVINSLQQWYNLVDSVELCLAGKNFKVTTDLDFTKANRGVGIKTFRGEIDFDNHTVKGSAKYFIKNYYLFKYVLYGSKLSNVTFDMGHDTLMFVYGMDCLDSETFTEVSDKTTVVFENIKARGNALATENNYSPFISRVCGNYGKLVMKNITNYVNIISVSSAAAGVFVGKVQEGYNYEGIKVEFDKCTNEGNVTHLYEHAGMLFSNACTFSVISLDDITVNSCENKGTISGGKGANLITSSTENKYVEKANELRSSGALQTTVETVPNNAFVNIANENETKFEFNEQAGATTYQLAFDFWYIAKGVDPKDDTHGSRGMRFELTAAEFQQLSASGLNINKWVIGSKDGAEEIKLGTGSLFVKDGKFIYEQGEAGLYKSEEISKITFSVVARNDNFEKIYIGIYSYKNYSYKLENLTN